MADLQRAKRLIEVAAQVSPIEQISYAGIDLFELRSANQGPELSLKQAHRELAATRARVRLVPGDPLSALARSANNLTGQDLIIISADQQGSTLDQAWFWVPRLLHAQTSVAIEVPGPQPHTKQLRWLSRGEIEQRAGSSRLRAA